MRPMLLLLALLLGSSPARALTADHEKFDFLGWNKQCSFAYAHYVFPAVGQAIASEPIDSKVGTLSIPPDATQPRRSLVMTLTGAQTWEPKLDQKARARLEKEGYKLAGYVEKLGAAAVVDQRDLPRLLVSTDLFHAEGVKWLAPPWKPSAVYYAPFASECAMMLYTLRDKPFYKTVLFRIDNPTVRADRAAAHVTNGLLLLDAGDDQGALVEEETAAAIDPDSGPAHYHHAAMLVLNGRFEPAIDELQAAAAIDPKFKKQARGDKNFDGLRWHPRFDELTK